MRLSLSPLGVLLGAIFSTTVLAQEVDTSTMTDYDVISAPALSSDKIKSEVLIEVTTVGPRMVAVGAHGNILWKEESDWQQAKVDTSVLLTSVAFSDPENGWATGHHGVIINTDDGGKTWKRQLDGYELMQLEKSYFENRISNLQEEVESTNDDEAIAELEFQIEELQFQISNIEVAEEEGPSKPFLDLYVKNSKTLWAIGAYGTFLKTENGGDSWQVISGELENPGGYHLNTIFGRGDNLYIVGEAGLAFASYDGGINWQTLNSPYRGSLFGGHLDAAGNIWMYGLRGNAYVSDDKGQSFTTINTGTTVNLSAGTSTAAGTQLMVGHSGTILEVDEQLNVKNKTHPSGSVMTDVIEVTEGEWIMTGRSGLLHWPAKITGEAALAKQQGAQ
ncbi:WD40/YVTN/BNR-like repeat-containing protein [Idiomarina aminovorans]|uniref:WD40/YVTN/BNR-like repeat-containing protein n=1 Tax=Idiomarina aminovorans TaxID=2914829 RepID=UPI002005E3CD|nr:YCF48-related protein [Idiomarina sp. ATCH4]MCK7458454.1 YCF48-related protein [Idiomarina sp. ATCH4]